MHPASPAADVRFAPKTDVRLQQFKNLRILRTLAENQRIKADCHNFRLGVPPTEWRKITVTSDGWLGPAKSIVTYGATM